LIPKSRGDESSGGMFSALKKEIKRVRKDNDPPLRDPESFSRYTCDLCHSSGPLSGLKQCVICGRWACTQCWHEDFYLCKSCGGIMHLLLMEIPGHKKQEDISESEETKEFVDSSDPFCQK